MTNFKLTVCYDGTRYRGWQKQGNTDDTVQQRLESCLSRILSQETELAGSGRTDAGVHAAGQVCSFRAETELDCGELLRLLRAQLPEDIGALSLSPAEPRFHARLNAREKVYVYRVWNSDEPNVFERRYLTPYPAPLDIRAMRRAAAQLIGRHDFSAFCSTKHMKKSAVHSLKSIELERLGQELRFTLTGDGFLYNMARIIVGTLLEVGEGTRSIDSVGEALQARDRALAGATAPAKGLCLFAVRY